MVAKLEISNTSVLSEPLRVQWLRSDVTKRWHTRVYRGRAAADNRLRLTPALESDWFVPGAPVYVRRSWTEFDPVHDLYIQRSEEWKARIVEVSRNHKVWVLVRMMKRKSVDVGTLGNMDHWWELRLVSADDIEPIGSGILYPPELPPEWAKDVMKS